MNTEKIKLTRMIGLAHKAGKLVRGTEQVNEAVRHASPCIYIVVTAEDVSANTLKRITNCCTYYNAEYISAPLTTDELADAVGNHGALSCVGITDSGFAEQIKILNEKAKALPEPELS